MINNYSLTQNSQSLKSTTEPPKNRVRGEKRGAKLPKPSHLGLHWEEKPCRDRPENQAAPGREPGATPDAAPSTSSPRGSLTAQTPHLRLPHPFCPGIKPASPPQDRRAVKTRQSAPLGRRGPAHANKHTRNPSRRPSPRALRLQLVPARAQKSTSAAPTGARRAPTKGGPWRRRARRGARCPAPPRPAPPPRVPAACRRPGATVSLVLQR
ncbi:WAS/WASL-interacting protein family member 2-like [Balaenoptera ricei]|uniref:WAS/WASL-interacting protein family member 2-like n=1 Tax=Balaenoptera ricei TaxID=2746895 RepID=UPI0028BF1621|nr:WAS/WASL-interacting protein family member 2-like [Balaenoptera ricei]